MKLSDMVSQPHKSPFVRFTMIILSVCLIDCVFVLFAKKPLPWAAIIPAFIPLLVVIFVIIPMNRASKS